jgi:hypothetical protein
MTVQRMDTLSNQKKVAAATIGIVLWFVFLIAIRYAPWAFDGGVRSVIVFLVGIPLMYVLVSALKAILGLTEHTIFEGVTIAVFAAALVDGLVFTFVPHWYGATTEHALFGAGLILWGIGWALMMAWMRYTRAGGAGSA